MFGQQELIVDNEENRNLLFEKTKCDKYDYIAAVGCGALGGLIDIFLVGSPGNSVLGNWSDKQIDKVVMTFAKKSGWKPRSEQTGNVASAIGFLEGKYKVNYDQRFPSEVNNMVDHMNTKNHHMMSLSHSPDIIGLFFSILNQFTSTSAFISNGKLIMVNTDNFELRGNNFISKLFCGVANWFGHIMSDIAGSSGSRGNGGRGSGIVMPFYELFQFCKVGRFKTGNALQDLSVIATRVFENGYDFRFGVAMAIPVAVTEVSIRLIWALRRYFQYNCPIKECIPTMKHSDLRVMLLIGNGTLCAMDGIDALVRSDGDFIAFFMKLNLVAWGRFAMLVFKEVCIRLNISAKLQNYIEAFKQLNEGLLEYLHELEKIDIEQFKKETQKYNELMQKINTADTPEELNSQLLAIYDEQGWEKPWEGDFDEFMSNKNNHLVFK